MFRVDPLAGRGSQLARLERAIAGQRRQREGQGGQRRWSNEPLWVAEHGALQSRARAIGPGSQVAWGCLDMVISALVITLDPRAVDEVVGRLGADPRFDLGQRVGNRLPAVVETRTTGDGCRLHRDLEASSGIWSVEVVMVDFSEEEYDDAA